MNQMDEHPVENADPILDFPIIGIGASAGGLEAVTEMFHRAPSDLGLAFVLVLHLDPNHESLMAELLSRKTNLPVRQVKDGDPVEIDTVHVIPPGFSMELKEGKFHLFQFSEPRGLRRPIDSFFTSLANHQGENAASVILSGTGADGSFGMRAIKEMGGICVAQLPKEARYDGMPASAITTDLVDYVLPAGEIAERLRLYFEGAYRPELPADADDIEKTLLTVFYILKDETGHDFSGYKRSTIFRRMERRLQVLEYASVDQYIDFLRESQAERHALFQDFLINVTSFFRDTDSFEKLKEDAIVPLVQNASMSDEIRIWVPGCSSGQEAYSIAMLVDEVCTAYDRRPLIQIFATDIDERMIEQARAARYPTALFGEIPARFQAAYTVGQDGQFEIVKRIRDMVRFSVHSLISNAPFSKIDLISCRNLLIYFGDEIQREVLPLFHFSLRPGGFLFLGNSENVTRREELFSPIDQQARIFKRLDTKKRTHITLPIGPASGTSQFVTTSLPSERDFPRHERLDASNLTIYEQYAPPFVRIALDGRIIDSSGDLSLFLMSRPSEERNAFSLARDGLSDVLGSLVSDASAQNKRMALKDISIISQFGTQKTDLIAHPMKDGTISIIFLSKDRLEPQLNEFVVMPASRDQRVAELQEELLAARHLLRSKVEEIETANEELKSSNEEMMSMNEELQSANEELTTANEELKNKIDELSVANADLDNFMQSSELVMVVLDRAFRIRHLTRAAKQIFPLLDSDRGRALTEFSIKYQGVDLPRAIRRVLETSTPFEQNVFSEDGTRSYVLRITPYFYGDGSVEGTTITLVDVSELASLRDDLKLESEMLRLALHAGNMGLAELDTDSNTVTLNEQLAEQFGLGSAKERPIDHILKNVFPEDVGEFEKAIDHATERGERYDVEFRVAQQSGDFRWIRTPGMPYVSRTGQRKIVGLTIDVTDEKRILENREMIIREMSHRVKNLFAVISALVKLSPKEDEETKSFANALVARIAALGETYDFARKQKDLSRVDFSSILDRILAPHRTGQAVNVSGPEVQINGDHLTTLTLMLHEMATNALKYGALSHDKGTLDISWIISTENMLEIDWSETVPDFKVPKDRKGFGSQLIGMGARQLGATHTKKFNEDGINIHLTIPID